MTNYVATSGQPVDGVTLNSGDTLYVSSGGTASGIIIDAGGSEQVAASGTAAATTVNAGGSATISLGGTADGLVDSSGGTVVFVNPVVSGAVFTSIGYGQTFSGVTQLTSATVELLNPAINGETLDLASGGIVFNATLTSGGSLTVQGGSSFGDNVGAGFEQVFAGLASGSMVSGGAEYVYGGVTSGTSLVGGSTQLVGAFGNANGGLSPASAVQTSLVSSTEIVRGGVANSTTVGSGGLQIFDTGSGSASGTVLNSGGVALVAGSAVFLNPVMNGGTVISSGVALVSNLFAAVGAAPMVAIESGQSDVVAGSQVEFVLASGTATSSMIDGQQSVFNGGVATGTVVTSNGTQTVYAGGQAVSAMVNGGSISILGGTATGMVLFNNAYAAVVSGNANATVVSSTATLLVETSGTASGSVVSNGGVIEVIAGGVANATQIGSGGSATISNGGHDNFAQVASGGIDIVYAGGVASGAVISSGGTLSLQTSGQASGTQLQQGGAIILQNFAVSSGGTVSFNEATDVLTVREGTKFYTQTLSGNYAGEYFHATAVPTNAASTQVTVDTTACYCAGTLILTSGGERPVETLAPGDRVVTASGGAVPVRWIGHRRIDFRAHPNRAAVQPVRILAGAFGDGLPRRDLLVSPEHAVFTAGVLVPAGRLVGCPGIAVDTVLDSTVYYHIELPRHDVVFAEGLPCESWLDTGNRAMFENAVVTGLHFDAGRTAATAWSAEAYAPLVHSGPVLDAVRERLGAAARQDFAVASPGRHDITVAPGSGVIRLCTPAGHAPGDARRLGVAVGGLWLDGQAIPLCDVRLQSGFHAAEAHWRWTDGAGALALGASTEPRQLTIEVAGVCAAMAAAA